MQKLVKMICVLLLISAICVGGENTKPVAGTPALTREAEAPKKESKPGQTPPAIPRPKDKETESSKEESGKDKDKSDDKDRKNDKDEEAEPKPYDKVITKDARSKIGIFTIHRVKSKWYYEIPKGELNKDFLWVARLAGAPNSELVGGVNYIEKVIRWERRNNKILLREMNYYAVADPKLPIAQAVAKANSNAILASFNVEAWGEEEAAVIDVTKVFAGESVSELGVKEIMKAANVDAARSWIDRISTFPENVEVEATNTYTGLGGTPQRGAPTPPSAEAVRKTAVDRTAVVHYSMVKLPEQPMMPRLFDDRVGFFTHAQADYGRPDHKVVLRKYLARWRLEKKDSTAALSEPVKPIVYYIDPATPKIWVPWIRRGIEQWQTAFEAAGFKNAIVAREAPEPELDPEWSIEDARYSVIRWIPANVENAMGPHIADPRSGEILNAPVSIWQSVLNLQEKWYFTQVGPLDPRAKRLPFPDDLMGQILEFVVAHEVGHTLGLQHNFIASSMYTIEQIRDREWVHHMGHCPSIMDYARFNYVAQPEDGIDPHDLIPRVGPYDRWAISWGYKPIPDAKIPEDELPTLDQWAREQEKTPWYYFSPKVGGIDPGDQAEAIGDADAITATGLGLKNLRRVMDMLPAATTTKPGDTYEEMARMYEATLNQWRAELEHVVRIIGGSYGRTRHVGQEGPTWTAVPKARQKAAARFVIENGLVIEPWLHETEILNKLIPTTGALELILRLRANSVLQKLMAPSILVRLDDQAARLGKDAYTPLELLDDIRLGIFGDLASTKRLKLDVYRRRLQLDYVRLATHHMGGLQNPFNWASPNAPIGSRQAELGGNEVAAPLYRFQLTKVAAMIRKAIPRAADRETRAHLLDLQERVAKVLDPFWEPSSPLGSGGAVSTIGLQADEFQAVGGGVDPHPGTCWPEPRSLW